MNKNHISRKQTKKKKYADGASTATGKKQPQEVFINTLPFSKQSVELLIVIALTVHQLGCKPIISTKGHKSEFRIQDVVEKIKEKGKYCIHDYTYTFVEVEKGFGEGNRVCPNIETPIGFGAWMSKYGKKNQPGKDKPKSLIIGQRGSEAMRGGTSEREQDNSTNYFQYENISIVYHEKSPFDRRGYKRETIKGIVEIVCHWIIEECDLCSITDHNDIDTFIQSVEITIDRNANGLLDVLEKFNKLTLRFDEIFESIKSEASNNASKIA